MPLFIRRSLFLFLSLITLVLIIQACSKNYFRNSYESSNKLIHDVNNLATKPFLKAHFKNGDISILTDEWSIDTLNHSVKGEGVRYDFNREEIEKGQLIINLSDVALFETNTNYDNTESDRILAITMISVIDLGIGIYCSINRKACFGSCPTFYIDDVSGLHYADAEGFSNAILPSMEYGDIDAIGQYEIDKTFSITMKNEALETHNVRSVKLYTFPVKNGEKVYQTSDDKFYLSTKEYHLTKALSNEGDITHLLKHEDRNERFSLADENDLSTKEEIYLEFNNSIEAENLGLVINFRQTLMTTYFIYNAMSYMGDEVGDYLTKLETDPKTLDKLSNGLSKELGKIDIYIWNENIKKWIFQGDFFETGPIAFNKNILPLSQLESRDYDKIKIKIMMTKGFWRIDHASLVNLKHKVEPEIISPNQVIKNGLVDNKVLDDLINKKKSILSFPGDKFKINFTFPENAKRYEVFLYSKGYYLEWMRENWLRDKDLTKLWLMLNKPKHYLIDEASLYKEYEKTMEEQFWSSKIDREMMSSYEKE